MCQGCHGIPGWRTAYPEVYRVPKIGGQHPAYLVSALKEYKSGDAHAIRRCARSRQSLSDADMANLAAYYAQSGTAGPRANDDDHATSARVGVARACCRGVAHGADHRGRPGEGEGGLPGVPRPGRQQPDRRNTRSSPASIPTTSRRRCATTSRARARIRSWAGWRRADREGHRQPGRVLRVAAGGAERASTEPAARAVATAPSGARLRSTRAPGNRGTAPVGRAVPVPLRLPHHFARGIRARRAARHGRRLARRAAARSAPRMPRRLVDRELLGDGEMQRQVQERIDVALSGRKSRSTWRSGASSIAWYSGCIAIRRGGLRSSAESGSPARCLRHASTRNRRASSRVGANTSVRPCALRCGGGVFVARSRSRRVADRALGALRRARDADVAAVQDQPVMRVLPELVRHDLHQPRLDLERVLAGRESRAVRDAEDVRVDGDRRLAERDVQHDVRGLAADARAASRARRDRAALRRRCSSQQDLATARHVLRLHVEKADRADVRDEAVDAELRRSPLAYWRPDTAGRSPC